MHNMKTKQEMDSNPGGHWRERGNKRSHWKGTDFVPGDQVLKQEKPGSLYAPLRDKPIAVSGQFLSDWQNAV